MAKRRQGHMNKLSDMAGHLHAVTDSFVPPIIDSLVHTALPCVNLLQPQYCNPAQGQHVQGCSCNQPPSNPPPSYSNQPPSNPPPGYSNQPPSNPPPGYSNQPPYNPPPSYSNPPPYNPQPWYSNALPNKFASGNTVGDVNGMSEVGSNFNAAPPYNPQPSYSNPPPYNPQPWYSNPPPYNPQPWYSNAPTLPNNFASDNKVGNVNGMSGVGSKFNAAPK